MGQVQRLFLTVKAKGLKQQNSLQGLMAGARRRCPRRNGGVLSFLIPNLGGAPAALSARILRIVSHLVLYWEREGAAGGRAGRMARGEK